MDNLLPLLLLLDALHRVAPLRTGQSLVIAAEIDHDQLALRRVAALRVLQHELALQIRTLHRDVAPLPPAIAECLRQAEVLAAQVAQLLSEQRATLGYEPDRWEPLPVPTRQDRRAALELLAARLPPGAVPGPPGAVVPDQDLVEQRIREQMELWERGLGATPQTLAEAVALGASRGRDLLRRAGAWLRQALDRPD